MPPKRWKSIELDYAWISAADHVTSIPVCLTWRERQILLSLVEIVGWTTRWTNNPVKDTVQNWRDTLVYKLTTECAVDCTDVWACLGITGTPPTDLVEWLVDQINENGDIITGIDSRGGGSVPAPTILTDAGIGCDLDDLYGFCLQLVQFMNRAIEDAYELLELKTNPFEFAQAATKEMSYVGLVVDFIAYLQDSIIEAYLANYDEDLEVEYACALMCVALENEDCSLSWLDVYQYFMGRFGAEFADTTVTDLLTFIVAGSWSGSEFCDASFATFANILYMSGEWFGITLERVQQFWATWLNDPNSDWESLCTCQKRWYAEFDFTTSQCGFTIEAGTYSAGVGLVAGAYTVGDPDSMRALGYLTTSSAAQVTQHELDVSAYTAGTWEGSASLWALSINSRYTGSELATRTELQAGGIGTYNETVSYTVAAGTIRLDGRASRTDSQPSGALTLSRLKLWGSGTAPDELISSATTFEYTVE